MSNIIVFEKAQLEMKARKGFRNWINTFDEEFNIQTTLSLISLKTLTFLAEGRERNAFYLYDLIMNLLGIGSGFEINELNTKDKMAVINRYLFLIDRIRFEYMKRLGWLESYPGENFTLVEQVIQFEQLAPGLQARTPVLSNDHPDYDRFDKMTAFEKEELVRKLLSKALKDILDHSTNL